MAIYIGNGQVVHASSPRTGIKISGAYYRNPVKSSPCIAGLIWLNYKIFVYKYRKTVLYYSGISLAHIR